MIIKIIKIFLFYLFLTSSLKAIEIKNIEITGNSRIPNETILLFAQVDSGDDLNENDLNLILNNIYGSNFFEDVKVEILDQYLKITVSEFPLIENTVIEGIKNEQIKELLISDLNSKSRTSFNEFFIKEDSNKMSEKLKSLGYYFSEVNVSLEKLADNKVNIIFDISLGEKSKIKKINFIGNKNFKNKKLRSLILSEEYKFWKFLSGRKYLNEELIVLDERLLRNFYLNNGFYNVKINSSFAKIGSNNEFQLIFNIEENDKFYFGELNLDLPINFNKDNFNSLIIEMQKIQGKPYSINSIDKILNKIDKIVLKDEFRSIQSTVVENLIDDKIVLNFKISEGEQYTLNRIDITGNNVTQENVIRNQLLLDEGDIFNTILANKSVNNIKSLNIFKSVNSKILSNDAEKTKTIVIDVEEKPTGEIMAGAGVGTDGGLLSFAVRENNYLGRGIKLNTELKLSPDEIDGIFSAENPNFKNTDKSAKFTFQAKETDKFSSSGYKSKKTGILLGTNFEYRENLFLGITPSTYLETIDTSNKASAKLRKQEGNYFDSFLNLDFDYDKRNQKFQTSEGYRSFYSVGLPIINEANTLKNSYVFSYFNELFKDNISKMSISLASTNSLSNDDIKLSERIFLPSSKLRGFELGKVGPKDGNDYIGGNYSATINLSSSIPQLFKNSQNLDAIIFSDIANVWGVDYSNSIDDSNKVRSSIGVGIDWFTPVGPLNFSLAAPLTKASTDKVQQFRFNLGTTF